MKTHRTPTASRWRVTERDRKTDRVTCVFTCWAETEGDAVDRLWHLTRPAVRPERTYTAERIA